MVVEWVLGLLFGWVSLIFVVGGVDGFVGMTF